MDGRIVEAVGNTSDKRVTLKSASERRKVCQYTLAVLQSLSDDRAGVCTHRVGVVEKEDLEVVVIHL